MAGLNNDPSKSWWTRTETWAEICREEGIMEGVFPVAYTEGWRVGQQSCAEGGHWGGRILKGASVVQIIWEYTEYWPYLLSSQCQCF